MEDITFRALRILKEVEVLFCEDTRVTSLLLKHFELSKKLIHCDDHNEDKVKEEALACLKQGKDIGLVTDRGTPIISDPGYKVVSYVIQMGYPVISLPGATAFVPSLTVSALSPAPFLFYGFLNAKSTKRERELETLERLPYTLIFYEAPHRIEDTLTSIKNVFGNRQIALCREISKMYEEIYRGTIEEVLNEIKDGIKELDDYAELSLVDHVKLYIDDGLLPNEAIKKVAKERKISKAIVYNEYHKGK